MKMNPDARYVCHAFAAPVQARRTCKITAKVCEPPGSWARQRRARKSLMSQHHVLSAARLCRPDEAPEAKLVQMVLLCTLMYRASKVIFERVGDDCRLTYVAGRNETDMVPPPPHLAPRLSGVFQSLCGLPSADQESPTKGSMRLSVGGATADVEVFIYPNSDGESIRLALAADSDVSCEARKVLDKYSERHRRERIRAIVKRKCWRGIKAFLG